MGGVTELQNWGIDFDEQLSGLYQRGVRRDYVTFHFFHNLVTRTPSDVNAIVLHAAKHSRLR